MFEKYKALLKDTMIYGMGNISTRIVGLILLPIYTSRLSVSDYGVLGIAEITCQLLVIVFGAELHRAFYRFYWDKDYFDDRKSMLFTALFFLLVYIGLLFLGIYPFANKLAYFLFESTRYAYLLKLMLINTGLHVYYQFISSLFKVKRKPLYFSISNIIKLFITLIVTVYLIVYRNRSVEAIYEAQIIGMVVYLLIVSKFVFANIHLKIHFSVLKDMIAFSSPLIMAAVSGSVLTISDRYCLRYLGQLSQVGIYSLGYKIANTIKLFITQSVQMAATPMMYQMIDDPQNKRFYSKLMTYLAFGVMFFVLFVSFFSREIVRVLAQNKDYWAASSIVPIISFAIYFNMLKDISMMGLNIAKRTKIIAYIIISVSFLNIFLNLLLIPKFSYIGASAATLVSQIIFFIIINRYAQKYYHIPYEFWKITKLVMVGLLLVMIGYFTGNLTLFWRLFLKSLLLISYPLILYAIRFYESIELQRLYYAWLKWRNPVDWKSNIRKKKLK